MFLAGAVGFPQGRTLLMRLASGRGRLRLLPMMKRILLVLFLALGAQAVFAATTEEAFTRSILEKLQKAAPAHTFEYAAPLEISDETSGNSIYLDRIYRFTATNPQGAQAAVESFVARAAQAMVEAARPPAVTALRLAVRNGEALKKSLEALGPGAKAAYPRDLAGDLVVVPVVDTPAAVGYLSERNLTQLGLTEAEAIQRATDNLRAAQRPLAEVAKAPPKSGIGTLKEEYAASRLIFVADWAAIEQRVGGNLVVMAPAFDTVLFGDGSNARAIAALRTLGLQVAKRSQVPLSSTVLRFKGDRWEPVK